MIETRIVLAVLTLVTLFATKPSLDSFSAAEHVSLLRSAATWISPKAFVDCFLFTFIKITATGDMYLGILGRWFWLPVNRDPLDAVSRSLQGLLPKCYGGCGNGFCIARDICICLPGYAGSFCTIPSDSTFALFNSAKYPSRHDPWLSSVLRRLQQVDSLDILIAVPILLHAIYLIFPSAHRFLRIHTTLSWHHPHTLLTWPLFYKNTWNLAFAFIPLHQYMSWMRLHLGPEHAAALLLWCALCSSVGSLLLERGVRIGGLGGVLAGLRLVVGVLQVQAMQRQMWFQSGGEYSPIEDLEGWMMLMMDGPIPRWFLLDVVLSYMGGVVDVGSMLGGMAGGASLLLAVEIISLM